jgi:hypothetical protein
MFTKRRRHQYFKTGSDINGLYISDATNANHLICYLHGYTGKA